MCERERHCGETFIGGSRGDRACRVAATPAVFLPGRAAFKLVGRFVSRWLCVRRVVRVGIRTGLSQGSGGGQAAKRPKAPEATPRTFRGPFLIATVVCVRLAFRFEENWFDVLAQMLRVTLGVTCGCGPCLLRRRSLLRGSSPIRGNVFEI